MPQRLTVKTNNVQNANGCAQNKKLRKNGALRHAPCSVVLLRKNRAEFHRQRAAKRYPKSTVGVQQRPQTDTSPIQPHSSMNPSPQLRTTARNIPDPLISTPITPPKSPTRLRLSPDHPDQGHTTTQVPVGSKPDEQADLHPTPQCAARSTPPLNGPCLQSSVEPVRAPSMEDAQPPPTSLAPPLQDVEQAASCIQAPDQTAVIPQPLVATGLAATPPKIKAKASTLDAFTTFPFERIRWSDTEESGNASKSHRDSAGTTPSKGERKVSLKDDLQPQT